MKKITALVLALLLAGSVFIITACREGGEGEDMSETNPITDAVTEPPVAEIQPVGLKEYTVYSINAGNCLTDADTGKNHDLTRLAVCIQGLINRENDIHHVAVNLDLDSTDAFWLNFISEEGATYGDFKISNISSTQAFLDTFGEFIKSCGIIAWDPEVPSTANVASTICGLENMLPVRYSTDSNSLYVKLTDGMGVEVKQSLVGMFGGAAVGGKIADTQLDSTGSAKCDAYVWALDKYFDRCNRTLLAYTLDGASAVPANPIYSGRDSYNAQVVGIPNHDYFILNKCFFFDLTSYAGETPNDDPDQPLGADASTLKLILQRRYDAAEGAFGTIVGFPPWHVKYTTHPDSNADLQPPRLEWHFVELVSTYNCGIEADAAHPAWMSNGSLYAKYQMRYEPKGSVARNDIKYDDSVIYFTMAWSGDFDCSPWMKARVPTVWGPDAARGQYPMTYGYNVNLIDRIPMAFDYVYKNQSENDVIVGGEGMGYINAGALFNDFEGKEANPAFKTWTGYGGTTDTSVVRRILPEGAQAYFDYAKPYFEREKVTVTSRFINGFTVLGEDQLSLLTKLSPGGVFVQNSSLGSELAFSDGVPVVKITDIGYSNYEEGAANIYKTLIKSKTRFVAFGYSDPGTNFGTVSGLAQLMKAFDAYWENDSAGGKYEFCYVDINTFIKLLRDSGLEEDY